MKSKKLERTYKTKGRRVLQMYHRLHSAESGMVSLKYQVNEVVFFFKMKVEFDFLYDSSTSKTL